MPRGKERKITLEQRLSEFSKTNRALPGIRAQARRSALVAQLFDSSRRTEYVTAMLKRPLSSLRREPNSPQFDPILGAILCQRAGEFEEACWLVFLATQFGKSGSSGWELCRAVYGRNGQGPMVTWTRTTQNVEELCAWINANADILVAGPPRRAFGNHRKYESLHDLGSRGTPATIRSYVGWIMKAGSHGATLRGALGLSGNDACKAFDSLYKSIGVASFGRLAKFDYLSMLGKLGLAAIRAGSTYMSGATGPLQGARLLFGIKDGFVDSRTLDKWLVELGTFIGVGMQDLEDALCNWQKSPDVYRSFRG
jgi:hypothetical protein